MVTKKATKQKPKKALGFRRQTIEELDGDQWSDGDFVSRISASKRPQGQMGIKIRTGKKLGGQYLYEHQYGVWFPQGFNIASWLKWLLIKTKEYTKRFWKEEINLDILNEKVDLHKREKEDLEKKLESAKEQLKLSEEMLKISEEDRELAKKATPKIIEYQKTLVDFIKLLKDSTTNDTRKEKEVKKFVKQNRWLLGLECEIGAVEKPIDNQTSLDLHIKTNFNQDKIFEFKSPNLKPFYKKSGISRLLITDDLAQGINQTITYLRKLNIYSYSKEEGTYGLRGPSGYVVIGYNLGEKEKENIADWNFHLRPHVLLLTYNDLVEHARRQLNNIRQIEKKEKR